jgi:hypothetical protein
VPPGQAAYYLTPSAVPSELFSREQQIIAWSEKQVGLSEMSIAATKPAGIDHAPGMEHLSDEQSIRQTPSFRAWEEFHRDYARICIDAHRLLAEYDPEHQIIYGNDEELKKYNWKKEIDMERDEYRLKIQATNFFATTVTAKINQLVQLVQYGIFTPQMAVGALTGNPDVKALVGDTDAGRRNIEKMLGKLERGTMTEKTVPHPFMQLDLALKLGKDRVNKLQADDAPDEVIDRIVNFCNAVQECIKTAQPPPAPVAPAASPGAPTLAAAPA